MDEKKSDKFLDKFISSITGKSKKTDDSVPKEIVVEDEKGNKAKITDIKPIRRRNISGSALIVLLRGNNIADLVKGKIDDGFFVDEKNGDAWFVGAQQPIMVRDKVGYTPMYILRFDSPFPSENLHPISPEFLKNLGIDERDKLPTPKLLYRILKMVVLSNVIRVKRKMKLDTTSLMIGVAAGVLLYYVLHWFAII